MDIESRSTSTIRRYYQQMIAVRRGLQMGARQEGKFPLSNGYYTKTTANGTCNSSTLLNRGQLAQMDYLIAHSWRLSFTSANSLGACRTRAVGCSASRASRTVQMMP